MTDEFGGHTIITAFLASLSGTASCYMLRPDGGAKVTFEVSEKYEAEAFKVRELRGRVVRVVIVDEGVADAEV